MEAERLMSPLCRGGSSNKLGSSGFLKRRAQEVDTKEDNLCNRTDDSSELNESNLTDCNAVTNSTERNYLNSSPKFDVISESRRKILESALNRDRNSDNRTKIRLKASEGSPVNEESPRSERTGDRTKVLERALSRIRKGDKELSGVVNAENEKQRENGKGVGVLDIDLDDISDNVNSKNAGNVKNDSTTYFVDTLNRAVSLKEQNRLKDNEKDEFDDEDDASQESVANTHSEIRRSKKDIESSINSDLEKEVRHIPERKISGLRRGASASVLVRSQRSVRDMQTGLPGKIRGHNIERPGSAKARYSPRVEVVRGVSPRGIVRKECDSDLKLSLKGLNDSDDETDDIEDNISPRKQGSLSPRKSLLSKTKSFEAKEADYRRKDNDSPVVRVKTKLSERSDSTERVKPAIKQGLKLKTFSNESLGPSEQRDTSVERPLRRTSSGRKLPGVPPQPKVPVKIPEKENIRKSESENSFLSIRKDGSTEYVALDLNSILEPDKNTETEEKETFTITGKVKSNPNLMSEMNSEAKVTRTIDKKPNGRSTSVDSSASKKQSEKMGKPPLERKASKGVAQGVPPSPRGSISSSPRKIVAASPRGAASPRVNNSPRVNSSPRARGASPRTPTSRASPREGTGRAATPREGAARAQTPRERKASIEKLKTQSSDSGEKPAVKQKLNDIPLNKGVQNGEPGGRRRTSSGSSLVSPRPGSPMKAKHLSHAVEGTLQTTSIKEEPVKQRFTRQDSCQQLDLQKCIELFQIKDEEVTKGDDSSGSIEVILYT
jgi:hypothetical protein